MKTKQPTRTLKRAVRLHDMKVISCDALMTTDADAYQEIRRSATKARNEHRAAYVCEECGYPVYAPREPKTKQPFWRHYKGAPRKCPWWTGDPKSPDHISGSQFEGAQESVLHIRLKNIVADLLRIDPLTERDSVFVDKYILSSEARRRPDVRAIYDGKPIAIEIQLATTQIPIIVAREKFYENEGRHLIWLTWNFEPVERSQLRTAFEDIFYSHNKNLFSLDDDVIADSRSRHKFQLRAFWEEGSGWQSKITPLTALTWPDHGLPFAVAPPPAWHIDFRNRWLAITTEAGTAWPDRKKLLDELASKLNLDGTDGMSLEEKDFEGLLNVILSFMKNKPIGSRQKNLTEVINTFLSSQKRYRFARLMRTVISRTVGSEFIKTTSVHKKFLVAQSSKQDDRQTATGFVVILLFPELFAEKG